MECAAATQGKAQGKPSPPWAQAIADVIHRSAAEITFAVALAELHRTDRLGIFSRHTNQRRTPHPEQRTEATQRDRGRHTGDVPGPDGGRQ